MKENTENKDWLLIAKHLGKELDEKQKEQFNQWLAESEEHRNELTNAERIWELSDAKNARLFNTDKGWNKMSNRIHRGQAKKSVIERRIFIQPMKIAASILVVLGLATLVYWFVSSSNYVNVTASDKKIVSPIILPDGTKVCLNAGSTLKYPKSFDKSATRSVELTGEAFFDVTHNAQQPFIIQTAKAKVKVLGTSFNVEAYQNSDSVQVVVQTGTVELSPLTNNEVIRLTKGNSGVYYYNKNKLLKSESADVNALAWKTNVIFFQNVNLDYVSKTINRLFSAKIRFDREDLKNCRVNVNFMQGDDLESIIKTIDETLKATNQVEIKKVSDGYIVIGKGCKT